MLDYQTTIDILGELARRRPAPVEAEARAAREMAAKLREFYYPKQRAFFTSKHKQRATSKTRRAGATAGGCREFLARALETPGFRATYATTTRDEAKARAWESDTKSGLLDLLRQYGSPHDHPSLEAWSLGGVVVEVRKDDLELHFANGSQLELFGAETSRRMSRKRGGAKHVFWIDEAQDFLHLEDFYDAVCIAALQDFKGEAWISGTPGKDCSGLFYQITKDDDDEGPPLAGWEVHRIAQVDNPFFGSVAPDDSTGAVTYYVEDNTGDRTGPYDTSDEAETAAVKVRWENTAEEAKRKKGWKGDEPDFVRELLGKWVRTDARYVYPVHAVPQHLLLYAPHRPAANPFHGLHRRFAQHPPWVDIAAAIGDLPRNARNRNRPYQWMYAIGADFGFNPDPFALVAWAFTHELGDVFEVMSWKCSQVASDDKGAYLKMLWDALPSVVVCVGDPAGERDNFSMWQRRLNLPITEANKTGKETTEELLADDIRLGRARLRMGSPLHDEMRHLQYLPTKPGKKRERAKHRKSADGKVHGDHCCDAGRYSHVELTHYLAKPPQDPPPPGSVAALELEAVKHEERIDNSERAHVERLAELDQFALESKGIYDY